MSMKPGQIVREGLPNAAFEPFRDPEMSVRRCSHRWNQHMMSCGSPMNAFVARAEPLD
jgi:hypothetical protein